MAAVGMAASVLVLPDAGWAAAEPCRVARDADAGLCGTVLAWERGRRLPDLVERLRDPAGGQGGHALSRDGGASARSRSDESEGQAPANAGDGSGTSPFGAALTGLGSVILAVGGTLGPVMIWLLIGVAFVFALALAGHYASGASEEREERVATGFRLPRR